MSYTGVRNFKTFIDEDGKYNVSCEAYDSSLWSWDNKRMWEKYDKFFRTGFNTKEELEYYIFQQALDGTIHGIGGKYACISWGNCKVKLPKEEQDMLDNLYKKHWDNTISKEEQQEAYTKYSEYRYKFWFKAWKKYLADDNAKRKHRRSYIVMVDYKGYSDIFVKSKGSMVTKFTYYENQAKIFNKTIDEIRDMFCSNPNYPKVSIIDVSNNIVGKGKYRHVDINLCKYNMHINEINGTLIKLK